VVNASKARLICASRISGKGPPKLHDLSSLQKLCGSQTRPPPRYIEGTLIEAMQNAWRFVDDEVLRERLREAKGIGTPATRAEIIGGLKKQGFLIVEGKHIVPTEAGLSRFGVLKQADPALVDPGVTAELECRSTMGATAIVAPAGHSSNRAGRGCLAEGRRPHQPGFKCKS
jgi:DNA topoisomerase